VNPTQVEGQVRQIMIREDSNSPYIRTAVQLDQKLLIYQQDISGGAAVLLGTFDYAYQAGDLSLSWSHDGRRLAAAAGGQARLHEFGDGTSPNLFHALETTGAPTTVAFAPDGNHLAVGGAGQGLSIWNCTEQREVLSLKTESPVRLLDWRSDAQRLAALHDDGTLTIWDTSFVPAVTPSGGTAPQVGNLAGGAFNLPGPFGGGGPGLLPGGAPPGFGGESQ
jgi:WD40 repeat protein